jgi:hypothetical protein
MTSERDRDAARRLGSASSCFSEDLRRVLALVASTQAVSTLRTSAATAAAPYYGYGRCGYYPYPPCH